MKQFQIDFIRGCYPAALASEKATGIRHEITIAQAIEESGWGRSTLAVECRNLFGIKANQQQIEAHHYHEFFTREQTANQMEIVKADFAVYDSLEDCFSAHTTLLSSPHYGPAMAVRDSLDEFAYMLGPRTKQHPTACGYSTLVAYHDRLLELVRLYSLSDMERWTSPAPETHSE